MLVAAGCQRLATAIFSAAKQARFRDELSDFRERYPQRLPRHQIGRNIHRNSKNKLKIFPIAECMLNRRHLPTVSCPLSPVS